MLTKFLQVAVAVIKNPQDQVLISKRDNALHQGGLWEFPGGKIEATETPVQALMREIDEELGITVIKASPLITVKHRYPDIAVQLNVFLVEQFSGAAKSRLGQEIKWIATSKLSTYDFPAANKSIITAARLPAFYAILNEGSGEQMLRDLQKILQKNIKLIQARFKALPLTTIKSFMAQAHLLCKQQGASLLINADCCFELLANTDGIHLTGKQLMAMDSCEAFRKNNLIIAASCHNREELLHAEQCGVDFVVLSPVMATKTHIHAKPMGWEMFAMLTEAISIPVYALGGLSPNALESARQAGAQGIAAIRAFLE
jgi:8-oxo-dGTP diphosphatase